MRRKITVLLTVTLIFTSCIIANANTWTFEDIKVPDIEEKDKIQELIDREDESRFVQEIAYENGVTVQIWGAWNNKVKTQDIAFVLFKDNKLIKFSRYDMTWDEFEDKYHKKGLDEFEMYKAASEYAYFAFVHQAYNDQSKTPDRLLNLRSVVELLNNSSSYLKTMDIKEPKYSEMGKHVRLANAKTHDAQGITEIYNKEGTKIIAKLRSNFVYAKKL